MDFDLPSEKDTRRATDSAPRSPSRQAGRNLQRKHQGIFYFVCPMDLPGITLRPMVDMTTAHSFLGLPRDPRPT